MDNIDLNLENYNLPDILSLFQLDYDFTEEQLKNAKKIVYKTHPDKCSLPKEYFLFFVKAYRILYKIYNVRKQKSSSTDYQIDKNKEHEIMLKKIKNKKNFNSWFNKAFEKVKIEDEETKSGYGDWFSSNENIDNRKITMNEMANVFEKKKTETKALINVDPELEQENMMHHHSLTREKPNYYSADIFSKLNYDDLKRAHTETVVPVSHDDYVNREKFNNVDELNTYRSSQNIGPGSLEQSKEYLKNRMTRQDQEDSERAFNLIRQDEQMEEANKKWWGQMKRLEN